MRGFLFISEVEKQETLQGFIEDIADAKRRHADAIQAKDTALARRHADNIDYLEDLYEDAKATGTMK